MYFVRGSELNDFLRCRLRWKMAWIDGLKAKKPNNKLFFGTLFHKFLEGLYQNNFGFDLAWLEMHTLAEQTDTSSMDEVEQQEIREMLVKVGGNYAQQYKDDLDNWEVIATELTFAIPLDDEIGYTGTIDLIVRDKKDGRIWFLDHKTTSSIDKYEKASDMDRQISRYWWALQQLSQGKGYVLNKDGEWVRPVMQIGLSEVYPFLAPFGFIYNIILKDYPVPPKVLKDGSLSKAKNQNTTYDLYWKALMDRYFVDEIYEDGESVGWYPHDEYVDILEHLRDNPREYFRRTRVFRTQAEIDASIEELYATGHEMDLIKRHHEHHKYNPFYRNITKDCPWDCAFMEICRAGMDGSNVDFLVDTLYTKEDTHE